MTATPPPLPGWPRGLREPLAAAYVGVSEALIRREVAAGAFPRPVSLTPGRQVWLREDLDRWLDLKRDGLPWSPSPAAFDWS